MNGSDGTGLLPLVEHINGPVGAGLGAGGMVALLFLGLFRGWLLTAKQHADRIGDIREQVAKAEAGADARVAEVVASKDAIIVAQREELTTWKGAWREQMDITADVRAQNRDIWANFEFVKRVFQAIRQGNPTEQIPGGDET